MGRNEASMAPHVFHILQGREDIRVLRLAEAGNQTVFRTDHGTEFRGPSIVEAEAREKMVRDPEELVPHGKEAFAGNAADAHPRAPDRAPGDHQPLRSVSIRPERAPAGRG